MTVTRLPISWHHPVCAARRPGKAVLVASGPVAGQERLGRVARNHAGEVDVISTPECSRSQASRASAVRARAAHQHVCASRRRSGSSRSSDAGAGRRSTPSTRGTRSAGNGGRSSTRTTVCRETSMASTASTRARRRRSARPAGACAADSVRASREAAHGRSAGRSPQLRTSGAGYPQRSVHAGHRAGRWPRSAHHARAPGSFRCRRPDRARPRPDPDPPTRLSPPR